MSNILNASVSITLTNDNPLMLHCGVGFVNYVEESVVPASLTPGLTLVDLDKDHVITGATVSVTGAREGDFISVDSSVAPSLSISQVADTSLNISGAAEDVVYQVS